MTFYLHKSLISTLCHQVLKESGPPHMKSFLTRVTVGEFSAEGEGNSKKLSKKRAALSILQDLKKLPFIPAVEKPKTHYKKRTKTILKVLPLGRGKQEFGCKGMISFPEKSVKYDIVRFFFPLISCVISISFYPLTHILLCIMKEHTHLLSVKISRLMIF